MFSLKQHFYTNGWCRFSHDPTLGDWVNAVLPQARARVCDPKLGNWLRYKGTWFAGVHALPNDNSGAIASSGPLRGRVIDFIGEELDLGKFAWDAAQISVCYPGYPQAAEGESTGRQRYRLKRDAAHIDGLLPEGEDRRRYLREHHGFILGIPLVEFDAAASPFVVWEGSHEIIREALAKRFLGIPGKEWRNQDITEAYHVARKKVFEYCKRVEIYTKPGEAFLVHRLALHGMAPWREGAKAGSDGRMICYFRPAILQPDQWLFNP